MTHVSPSSSRPAADACRCRFVENQRAGHDRLIKFEDLDHAGILELLQDALAWHETQPEHDDGSIAPADWPDFAGLHNWRDPIAVVEFFAALAWVARQMRRAAFLSDLAGTLARVVEAMTATATDWAAPRRPPTMAEVEALCRR